ncbi:nuclease Le3 [Capsaspora owczarzaki ATCC 30864]|uniref:Nuclease Le3 n=1 Tax=Capsaspora owczarzaki (strain ATCC 30864) TaxID=595528 RepID=A0A0D2WWH8_CAPO3|nr:nuclease Le3 [Capsaspora owczarzaki ATCC 30864]KJE96873.1 nuclease Le3 [Capsaspora owczarzaki ATCC 30864]|eukprot:XP_004343851.2 nuclease Le3 [Capsaspora owczarzaki ATCC 30864]
MHFRSSSSSLLSAACVVIAVAAFAVRSADAWGAQGHQITAAIAQALLTPEANNYVIRMLPTSDNKSLAVASTWADDIKNQAQWKWTQPLHFIDTPDFACNYNYNRDCIDVGTGTKDACVAGAINNYTGILVNAGPKDVSELLQDSLKFVDHFIGDIHQPLHVGFTSDLGGNTIEVNYNGVNVNLHAFWDYSAISNRIDVDFNGDQNAYVNYLLQKIHSGWGGYVAMWNNSCNAVACPDIWATESVIFACNSSYADINRNITTVITTAYYNRAIDVIEQRLAAGGIRLGASLNRVAMSVNDTANNAMVGAVIGSVLGAVVLVIVAALVVAALRKRRGRTGYTTI